MWRPGSKPHAVGQYVWSLIAAIVRHDIMSLAAVITFYAFFSLFPFLLLVIYTASTIVPQLDVQNADVQRELMHLIGPFSRRCRRRKSYSKTSPIWRSSAGKLDCLVH